MADRRRGVVPDRRVHAGRGGAKPVRRVPRPQQHRQLVQRHPDVSEPVAVRYERPDHLRADRTVVLKAIRVFLAAACICSAPGIQADECEPFELRIHLQVDRSIRSRVVLADLKEETESVWRPYGVQIEWTDVRADETATQGLSLEAILEPRIGEEPNEP